jgi:hypothetical protein
MSPVIELATSRAPRSSGMALRRHMLHLIMILTGLVTLDQCTVLHANTVYLRGCFKLVFSGDQK